MTASVPIPSLLYGTAWKAEKTHGLVVRAILAGFKGIDTACQPKHYHQPGVGSALRELDEKHNIKRTSLFLQTKFTSISGQDPNKPLPYDPAQPLNVQVRQSFERSLQELQTSYIDSLVLHSPPKRIAQLEEIWSEFEKLADEGLVRMLGISNIYDPTLLQHCLSTFRIKPAVIQNRFYSQSSFDMALHPILGLCSPPIVYQSFWTLTANPRILRSTVVIGLAKRLDCTPAQAFFFYLITERGFTVLSGTQTHMDDDIRVQAWVEGLQSGDEAHTWRKIFESEKAAVQSTLQ